MTDLETLLHCPRHWEEALDAVNALVARGAENHPKQPAPLVTIADFHKAPRTIQ